MDITNFLESSKIGVEEYIRSFFLRKKAKAEDISPHFKDIVNALEEYTLRGGKRIRAALVRIGYLSISDQPPGENVIKAGAAMELIQSFLLVHDDIVDRDDLRRGAPSLHVILQTWPKGATAGEHQGLAGSLLAGDVAAIWALEEIGRLAMEPVRMLASIQFILEMIEKVLAGEVMDVAGSSGAELDKGDIQKLYELKTASYSFTGPLHLGGLLAGASKLQLDALDSIGTPLGVAFQIMDDMLGMFGEPEATGKPAGADLKEGKKTLLILETLGRLDPGGRNLLLSYMGVKDLGDESVGNARMQIEESGAVRELESIARRLTEQALDDLKVAPLKEKGKLLLSALAKQLLARKY